MKRLPLSFVLIIALVAAAGLVVHASTGLWTDGQDALFVIGQPDFHSNGYAVTASALYQPRDVAVDVAHGKLYVVDWWANRVLRYAYPITQNQPSAELVFGQPNFASWGSGTTTNTFSGPRGLDVDDTGRLWVAEWSNARVVWFDEAYAISSNQPDADGVLGQPDFVTADHTTSQNGFYGAYDVVVAPDGTLFVAEPDVNRVLRFDNAASKPNGADADGVLGQSLFTTYVATTTQSGMWEPHGVALYNGSLFVADSYNARVLRFDDGANKPDGGDADGVLGQDVFTTSWNLVTQDGLDGPGRLAVDCMGRLYVSDSWNADRVLIYSDAVNKVDGAPADNVIGQVNFTSQGAAVGPNRFNLESTGGGLDVDCANGLLLVADDNNHRVMIFRSAHVYLPLVLRGY
jgi:sugar lactone lactonase YvrE